MKDELQPRAPSPESPAAKPRRKKRAPRKQWYLRVCFPLTTRYDAKVLLEKIAAAVGRRAAKEVAYGQAVAQFEFPRSSDALIASGRALQVLVDVATGSRVIALVSNRSE